MPPERRVILWLVVAVGLAVLVYALRGALWPFLAGMAVAYLLDPVADRLEAMGCPRAAAAASIVIAFIVAFLGVLLVLGPLLAAQIAELVSRIPSYVEQLRAFLSPLLADIEARLTEAQFRQLQEAAGQYTGQVVVWLGGVLGGLVTGGVAVVQALSVLVIMPLVAFYLLRDWDRIVAHVDSLLPRGIVDDVRAQMREVDLRLSGFVRGQGLMCLTLATWFAIGLTLVGLDFGLLVGLGAGFISFIPYVGTVVGLSTGLGLALAQFSEWLPIAGVALVFASGQILQDFVLTPKLIGDRVGLHPAWVLFALLAGGTLLGFTGVLLAVPAAAVIGVFVRFAVERYLASPVYDASGSSPAAGADGIGDDGGADGGGEHEPRGQA